MKLFRFLAPLLVLLLFFGMAFAVVKSRNPPEPEPREDLGVLVEVEAVERAPHRLDVEVQGTVVPARQVVLQPQVGGRVEWVASGLAPGRRMRGGEPVFRIERADFELAVASAQAALAEAEAQLELERGRGRVAEREWELFREELDDAQRASALALREPQLRAAEATVATARSRLDQAELDLSRTVVKAPWNALVLSESLEVGQTVNAQSQVASLVGTDSFWVRASVPADELPAVALPTRNDPGAPASVAAGAGERTGQVVRLLGDVDPAGRMARVLIEVDRPLDRLPGDGGVDAVQPLLLDSFVNVSIAGVDERELFAISRDWLKDGREVWLFVDGQLEMREVEVVWRSADRVLVDGGLADGDLVVTSRIPTPVPGMKLRRLANAGAVAADRASGREDLILGGAAPAVESDEETL